MHLLRRYDLALLAEQPNPSMVFQIFSFEIGSTLRIRGPPKVVTCADGVTKTR
jgi:hypothetical protein